MNICILYGGRSGEHEVSLRSAASVVKNLDPSRYSAMAIGIDKAGRWHLQETVVSTSVPDQGDTLSIAPSRRPVSIVPSDGIHVGSDRLAIDCVFPVLHGSFGVDGTIQGLLEIAGLAYVGAGVLGSAASMDKEMAKRLWRDAGLPIVDFVVVDRASTADACRTAGARIGWPLFVKPCAAGSSLGASRVVDGRELDAALAEALRFDTRALLERYIDAREIECAVVGNSIPRAFTPGEIVPSAGHTFYDYDAKYTDPDGAALVATAALDAATREHIMRTAEAAYAAVRCEGMARVDFFLERGTGAVFLNEINTIPGFTSISMFPRMCEASGLSYSALLDTLIELALARSAERRSIRYEK
jgi:D-alanine-D-alanine ligase